MPPLNVTCPHCNRVTSIDSSKVPDHPVSYKCPGCQGKVVIDKKKILTGSIGGAADLASAQPSTTASATAGTAGGIQELSLPPGESLPPGIAVFEDAALGQQLSTLLEPFDGILEVLESAEEVHQRALLDPPPLIVYVARSVGKPPYDPLEPIVTLPPRERRQSFVVLVADNVKTLDGNLAFLFQVNLLLNRQHVPQAPGILYSALRHHQRLYHPYFSALGENH